MEERRTSVFSYKHGHRDKEVCVVRNIGQLGTFRSWFVFS